VALGQLTRSLNAGEKLEEIGVHIGAAHRAQLRTILEAEASGTWVQDGLDYFSQWVALKCDVSGHRARRMIACARKLDELPLIADALESGALGLDKVIQLTRFVPTDKQARWIRKAQGMTVAVLTAYADEANAVPVEEVQNAELARYLASKLSSDGLSMSIYAALPAFEGSLVMAAIDGIAEELQPTPEDEAAVIDPVQDTLGMRRADALVEMAMGCGDGSEASETLGGAPTLVVHAELDALSGEQKSGALEDGPVLHPSVVQQIACDPRLQIVLEDNGTAVGIGYESRDIPKWMQRQLKRRDRCCQFPGCNRRAFLQGHHVTPWPAGETDVRNLVCLCWRHHKLIHLFKWRVTLAAERDPAIVEWYRPDGRRFEPGPSPGV
jgi:hypothetical protein